MASREAIRAYAHMIDKTNPELANDLWLWLDDIDLNFRNDYIELTPEEAERIIRGSDKEE
jgi:hypothetical protein